MTYGHGGMMPGYLSEMEYFIDYELAVALQINRDYDTHLREIGAVLAEAT